MKLLQCGVSTAGINNTETHLEPVPVSVDLVCSGSINHGLIGESSECTESFLSNNKKI